MFEASHPFVFFDYFRVPYRVSPPSADFGAGAGGPVHRLRLAGQSGHAAPSLLWLASDAHPAAPHAACRVDRYKLGECTFFGHVAYDAAVHPMVAKYGRGWRPAEPILDAHGHAVAAVWRDISGSIFLPFDPGQVMLQFWSEKYRDIGRSPVAAAARAAMLRGYYAMRPALPRWLQVRARRAFTRVQARSSFPRWPVEESLHDLYAWLFARVVEVAGRPVPFLGLWPRGRSCALVLTHDVETAAGYRDMELLRAPERERGYRSAWNFVALRYPVDDRTIRALRAEGCEVGVHGLLHDGRDLASWRLMEKRLPAMREYAARWNAVGFRSPATQRAWELMPRLGFEYDSSYSDTDPFEPQPGGCCTYLPYFNQNMVELPITLPQDHTLFYILRSRDAGIWLRKARLLRQRNGMVLVVTHPDYARNQRLAQGYRDLLDAFEGDETVWHALPGEVATWWRRRGASAVRSEDGAWIIAGPAAADGSVRFAGAHLYSSERR